MSALEKPILLGVEGESKNILLNYRAGLSFIPEDKKSFINQLLKLKNDKDLYLSCQIGCRKLSKDFDRKILAREMLDLIRKTF